ncbi:hypothetical protein COO60DRAFT_1476150 [Scenedesmus sp. NREL 46B-D3]|nr:hypothetical protein COO60DRAFT_1476150 [Scenedesmus sp. NREL 46B-D3]
MCCGCVQADMCMLSFAWFWVAQPPQQVLCYMGLNSRQYLCSYRGACRASRHTLLHPRPEGGVAWVTQHLITTNLDILKFSEWVDSWKFCVFCLRALVEHGHHEQTNSSTADVRCSRSSWCCKHTPQDGQQQDR